MAKKIGATLSLKEGNFFTNLKSATSATQGFKKNLTGTTSALKAHGLQAATAGKSLKSLAGKVAGVVAAYAGFRKIVSVAQECIEKAKAAEEANVRLNTIMSQIPGITDSAKSSVAAYCKELSNQTTIGATAQKNGASQLASFQMSADSIKKLMPQLDNLAVAQYGVNVTSEQMIQAANMLGKAYSGQTGAMTRAGIVMSDAQAKVIKTGTDAQKASMLVEVLNQNFGDLAKQMAKTDEGPMIRLKNAVNGIKTTIGTSLLPMIATIATYVADKIPAITSAVEKGIDKIKTPILWIKDNALPPLLDAFGSVKSYIVDSLVPAVSPALENLFDAFKKIADAISNAFGDGGSGAMSNIAKLTQAVLPNLINILATAAGAVANIIEHWDAFAPVIGGVVGAIALYKGAVMACNIYDGVRAGLLVASTAATKGAAAAQTLLNTAFIASPIGWIVLGIAAVVTAFVLLWKKCEGFRNFWKNVWAVIKNVAGAAFEAIKGGIEKIKQAVGAIKEKIEPIVNVFKNVFGAAKDTVSEKLNNIKSAYEAHGGGIKGAAFGAIEAVKGYYSAGFSFIDKLTGGKLSAVVDKAKEKFSAMKDAISDGFSRAVDFVKKSYDEGALKPVVDKLVSGFNSVKDKIAEKFSDVKEAIGDKLADIGVVAVNAKNGAVEKFNSVKESIAEKFNGVKERVMPIIAPIAEVATNIFGRLRDGASKIIDGIKQVIANSVIIIRKKIADTIIGIKNNFRNFADSFRAAFDGIKNGISSIFGGIKNIISGAFQFIVGIFTFNIDTIKGGIQSIKDGFAKIFGGVIGIVQNVWNIITSAAQLAFENLKTIVTNAIDGVRRIIGTIKDTFSNVFGAVKDTVKNVFEKIKDSISRIWDNIKNLIKTPHIVQKGTISIAGMDTPIPKLGVDWYAKGGIMRNPTVFGMNGSNAMVGGEAGAEAILPLDLLWKKLRELLSDRGTPALAAPVNTYNINISVDGRGDSEDTIAEKVARKIVNAIENM